MWALMLNYECSLHGLNRHEQLAWSHPLGFGEDAGVALSHAVACLDLCTLPYACPLTFDCFCPLLYTFACMPHAHVGLLWSTFCFKIHVKIMCCCHKKFQPMISHSVHLSHKAGYVGIQPTILNARSNQRKIICVLGHNVCQITDWDRKGQLIYLPQAKACVILVLLGNTVKCI